ncbi:MAG: hypothetical protein ABIX28_04105 [Vicinamibacterales bacterium]
MTFDVEIVLRERNYAVTERLDAERLPASWTEGDVAHVLRSILSAMDRAMNPDATDRVVALRGFSWIVEPTPEGVVIAIEIPSGAAVAGPFQVEQRTLDSLITRVLAAHSPVRTTIH